MRSLEPLQVQLPKSLEVEEHVDIRLDDDEPGTVAAGLEQLAAEFVGGTRSTRGVGE